MFPTSFVFSRNCADEFSVVSTVAYLYGENCVALDEFIIIRTYFYAHNFTRNGIFRKTYTDIHLLKSNQVRRYIEQAS